MKTLNIDHASVLSFITEEEVNARKQEASRALENLHEGNCLGNDFLGWIDLPARVTTAEIENIETIARNLRQETDLVVIIGIGGSYLGAKAVIEALSDTFNTAPRVIFAGHNLSGEYLSELSRYLKNKKFGICVISKSGTTTEPAIAFRLLYGQLLRQEGADIARSRVLAITDARRGALRDMAQREGYRTLVIPDDIGGRYSVLTPVGLLPIALAGFNIRELLRGAVDAQAGAAETAITYAALRSLLYNKGYAIEITVNYNPKLHYLAEWWKQLYGESEGKQHRGIFPASVDFTTDLHSMGQYIQEGARILFETVISVDHTSDDILIPADPLDLDQLNYLAGKPVDEVNKMAELGTRLAHVDGGVPNIRIILPELTAYHLGYLLYFYQLACGISGLLLDVNPFDQPGVEAYKNNMFKLLGKP